MTIVLSIVIAILLSCLFCMFFLYKRADSLAEFWEEKYWEQAEEFVKLSGEYDALEEGRQETESDYEQLYISMQEALVDAQSNGAYWEAMAAQLEEIRLNCESNCLPRLGEPILDTSPD